MVSEPGHKMLRDQCSIKILRWVVSMYRTEVVGVGIIYLKIEYRRGSVRGLARGDGLEWFGKPM